jgi:hypothetical protein
LTLVKTPEAFGFEFQCRSDVQSVQGSHAETGCASSEWTSGRYRETKTLVSA